MKKIIDIRLRPPVGSFLKNAMFRDKERTAQMGKDFKLAPSVLKESMDLLIEEMESLGNYIGCIIGYKRGADPVSGWVDNREVYEIVQKYPGRFLGIGGIDLSSRRKALDDVEQCVNEYGFKAINLEPGFHKIPMYYDDRRLYPIYSKCADLGLHVFLLLGGNHGPDMSYTNPIQIEHVADDMPDLTIILNHGGWPWVPQIFQAVRRRDNIYLSADLFLTYPGTHQYIEAVNDFLSDRFFYGTGYPFAPLADYYEKFKTLGIKEGYIDKILYQNLERVLKL
jgi:predicted TIM-barrel fold metal-dependent hydrolase